MKKFAKILYFTLLLLLLANCGEDNAFSGQGIIGGGTSNIKADAFSSLKKEVFEQHATHFVEAIQSLQNRLKTTTKIELLQPFFKEIMQEWKSVEASYIVADYDKSLIDTPQLIDFYRTGKKLDIPSDIDKALGLKIGVKEALFKNSSQSITALEYLLFGESEILLTQKERRIEAVEVTLTNLEKKAQIIVAFYQADTQFTRDVTEASNSVVNVLSASSFKLKEWRIGEPSGIASKFKDEPNPSRLEYAKSKLSLEAITSILKTHQEIMGVQSYANFGSFASQNGAIQSVQKIQKELQNALEIIGSFSKPLEEMISKTTIDTKVQKLYESVKNLQKLYLESLIQALNLTAEIIEADGD